MRPQQVGRPYALAHAGQCRRWRSKMKTMMKHFVGVLGCSVVCLIVLYLSFTSYLSSDGRRPAARSAELRFAIGKAAFTAYMAIPKAISRMGNPDTSALHGSSERTERRMFAATIACTLLYGGALYACLRAILGNRKRTANQASDATSEPAPGADSSAHQG